MSTNKEKIDKLQFEMEEIRQKLEPLNKRLRAAGDEVLLLEAEDFENKFDGVNLDALDEETRKTFVYELLNKSVQDYDPAQSKAEEILFAWLQKSSPLVSEFSGTYTPEYNSDPDGDELNMPHLKLKGMENFTAEEIAGLEEVAGKMLLASREGSMYFECYFKKQALVEITVDNEGGVEGSWYAPYRRQVNFASLADAFAFKGYEEETDNGYF